MGRKQLNHVQYKRNIDPALVEKMDRMLIYFKKKLSSQIRLRPIVARKIIKSES